MDDANLLRSFLNHTNLTQAAFARLMGVSVGAVTHWLSGIRPLPGPVLAYISLFVMLPESLQQRALAAFQDRIPNMNGIYRVNYRGTGEGYCTLTFKDGLIYGFDEAGAKYDGHYQPSSNGFLDVIVTVSMPANVQSVVGGLSYPVDWTMIVQASVAAHLPVQQIVITTSMGPSLAAEVIKIRDLPLAA